MSLVRYKVNSTQSLQTNGVDGRVNLEMIMNMTTDIHGNNYPFLTYDTLRTVMEKSCVCPLTSHGVYF